MRKSKAPRSEHFMSRLGRYCAKCKEPYPCPTQLEERPEFWATPEAQEWMKNSHALAAAQGVPLSGTK